MTNSNAIPHIQLTYPEFEWEHGKLVAFGDDRGQCRWQVYVFNNNEAYHNLVDAKTWEIDSASTIELLVKYTSYVPSRPSKMARGYERILDGFGRVTCYLLRDGDSLYADFTFPAVPNSGR